MKFSVGDRVTPTNDFSTAHKVLFGTVISTDGENVVKILLDDHSENYYYASHWELAYPSGVSVEDPREYLAAVTADQ